jgi:catechol 2,3-dioxygenase-like lactoylglutathione lyase family enzyme
MSNPKIKSVNPVLPARDVSATVSFFLNKLGFARIFQDAPTEPKYAGVRRQGVELHIQWHDPAEWAAVERPSLRFNVEDLEGLLAEFRNRDAMGPEVAIRSTPWGTKEFAFFDPNQNGLTFYSDLEV